MSAAQFRSWPRALSRGLRLVAPLLAICFLVPASGAPTHDEEVIVPKGAVSADTPATAGNTGTGPLTMIGVIVLGGAGAWLLWRGRAGGLKQFSRVNRQLAIEETRSLGNRQFLVVASYQDKKFLIGVCPGRIDLLSPLHATSPVESVKVLS